MTSRWAILSSGYRVWGAAEARCRRAVERLAATDGVAEVTWVPPPSGGLAHEAGGADERAAALVEALDGGRIAVLANGPVAQLPFAGDPLTLQMLEHLGRATRGRVIGAMWHAHFLSELALRAPGIAATIATPFAEALGHPAPPFDVRDAMASFAALGDRRSPASTHASGDAWTGVEVVGEDDAPLRRTPIAPRVHRAGTVTGPVLAANLAELCLHADRMTAARWAGSILHLETSHLRLRTADNHLQRLRQLGVLDAVGALVLGVPVAVQQGAAMAWDAIVDRAVHGLDTVTVVDAFVGSGHPAPVLELGRPATLAAGEGVAELVPAEPAGRPA